MAIPAHEAMLYDKLADKMVKCKLCSHRCTIGDGKIGFCHARQNRGGTLYSLVYGKCCSWAVDPIEKKPFYHFMPGTRSLSFATVGCNFRCLHCQNWEISQPASIFGDEVAPSELVQLATGNKCQSIAYTYTEPTIFFEYAHDTALLAREEGLANVFVTNGYMTPETINEMGFVDASRIDLKAFTEKFYKEVCSARLEPVLESIRLLHRKQHIEIINLVIPELNDSDDELRALSKWVAGLDKEIPLHFTAYYPANKMTKPPTPLSTLQRARKIALEEGLSYVYTGNVPGDEGENTYCPKCQTLLIRRAGFGVSENNLENGKCPACGRKINIITEIPRK